jgi:hypothetical protein
MSTHVFGRRSARNYIDLHDNAYGAKDIRHVAGCRPQCLELLHRLEHTCRKLHTFETCEHVSAQASPIEL